MKDLEHQHQKALVTWAGYAAGADPRLRLLYAVPNGGLRNKIVAAKLKASGAKAGIPDLHLPVPIAPYAGLWIEMKAGKNTTTPEQDWWLETLAEYGHAACVCYGWEAGKHAIETYLAGTWPDDGVQTIQLKVAA